MSEPSEHPRRKWLIRAAIALGLVVAIFFALGLNTAGRYTGLTVPQVDPSTLSRLLQPAYTVTLPDDGGAGRPYPTILLLSGCNGPRENMEPWAQAFADNGWAAVAVDSHTPRGFTEFQLWRLICTAQLLTGAERAGDLAVALADVHAMPWADTQRLALFGQSHGGWTILEFLSAADADTPPLSLTRWPAALQGDPLDGIMATILLYPYCGTLSRVSRDGWDTPVPSLFLLAEGDRIAPESDCLELVNRARQRGLPVSVHIYDDVTHGFDQQDKSPLSILEYYPEAAADALRRSLTFLKGAAPR